MFIEGVSTRKVSAIVEKLCGKQICSSQVSRVVALLDETLESWHARPLGVFPYVFLDTRCEKVRQNGQIRDAAILIGSSVDLQ
jgi:transposase-like protein